MRGFKHLGAGFVVSVVSIALTLAAADAGIIYRVSQVTPTGAITIPATATFAVTLESDSGNQQVTGVDFTVNLSDTAKMGGVITSGSNFLFPGGANGFFASDFPPAGSGLTADYTSFSFTPVTMTTTPTTIATFTLDTSGVDVVPGTYTISLSGLEVADASFQQVLPTTQVPTTYTLQAVPEPSTIAMAGLAVGGGMAVRWKSAGRREKSSTGTA